MEKALKECVREQIQSTSFIIDHSLFFSYLFIHINFYDYYYYFSINNNIKSSWDYSTQWSDVLCGKEIIKNITMF